MNKSIDGFKLKMIAIIAMLLNHIGSGFKLHEHSDIIYFFTEFVGKLTFPIMAFLLVEGFFYTHNRKKYAERLAVFWIISIYPFHMLFGSNHPFKAFELVNNIFFTLLIGLILMACYEKLTNKVLKILSVVVFSLITIISDWPLIGILLIFGFYKWRNRKVGIWLPTLYTTLFLVFVNLMVNSSAPKIVPFYEIFTGLGVLLVIPLLYCYSGERGYSAKWQNGASMLFIQYI